MPDGLFGVFRDSLPDDWGRLLQDRKLAGMGIRQGTLSSLAPAYDLTQDEGFLGEHATLVNGKGSEVRERDLLAVGSAGGLSARRARAVIRQVEEVVGETLG